MITKKVGIIFGMENTFPPAVVERINSLKVEGVSADFVKLGGVKMADPSGYRVIIDRISHNQHPEGTTDQSMRNLMFPLNWDEIFEYVGFPAFLKPYSGGGWKHVYKVHSPEEFFHYYNQTGDLCMTLQHGVEFKEYFRCYVVGQENVHVMHYDPKAPFHERYVKNPPPTEPKLYERVVKDARTLCRALGYDLNTVEFAVEDGIPYAIDFLNPAPDAEITSVGQANFEWIVEAVAELAVKKALSDENPARELRWAGFLKGGDLDGGKVEKSAPRKRRA